MISERWILKLAADYSARLGIPCPEIRTQRSKTLTTAKWTSRDGRNLGVCHGEYLAINRYRATTSEIRDTVAHEVVHHAFPNLNHGPDFQRYIDALARGEMFFRGSIRRPDRTYQQSDGRTAYVYGELTWYGDDQSYKKTLLLDTKMPPEPSSLDEDMVVVHERLKKIYSNIGKLERLKVRYERKLRHLDKKAGVVPA